MIEAGRLHPERNSCDPGDAEDDRSRAVLDAMESHLRTSGIRAVVMSELASELSMSTKTLYRLFPSKDALVLAVVDRWSARFVESRRRRVDSDMSSEELIRTGAQFLVRRRASLSPQFWEELESDHPEAWERYLAMLAEGRRASVEWTARAVRPGVDAAFARAVLTAAVERAAEPEVLREFGLSTTEAIDMAVDIWSRGAFVDPDAPPPPA